MERGNIRELLLIQLETVLHSFSRLAPVMEQPEQLLFYRVKLRIRWDKHGAINYSGESLETILSAYGLVSNFTMKRRGRAEAEMRDVIFYRELRAENGHPSNPLRVDIHRISLESVRFLDPRAPRPVPPEPMEFDLLELPELLQLVYQADPA